MSYLFALLQKIASLFESPHLPMDSDYSYQARQAEAERVRKHVAPFSVFVCELSRKQRGPRRNLIMPLFFA